MHPDTYSRLLGISGVLDARALVSVTRFEYASNVRFSSKKTPNAGYDHQLLTTDQREV